MKKVLLQAQLEDDAWFSVKEVLLRALLEDDLETVPERRRNRD